MSTRIPTEFPDLIDLALSKPKCEFSKTFPFVNKQQRETATQTITKQVTGLLQIWLKDNYHSCTAQARLAERDVFVCGDEDFQKASITQTGRTNFQSCIRERIKQFLEGETLQNDSLHFSSDYSPGEELSTLLAKSGITFPPFTFIFPKQCSIEIKPLHRSLKPVHELQVSVDLTAPPPLKPDELRDSVLDSDKQLDFRRTLFFKDREDQRIAVEDAATQVADFLSVFLTKEGRSKEAQALLKKKDTWTFPDFHKETNTPSNYGEDDNYKITLGKIETFKTLIAATIEEYLIEKNIPVIIFSTDVRPEEELLQSLTDAKIGPQLYGLFPINSSVDVSLRKIDNERGEIEIDVSFAS